MRLEVVEAWTRRLAPSGGDLTRRGEQVALGMLTGIRLVTVVVVVALAMLPPGACATVPLVLLGVVAIVEVLLTTPGMLRARVGGNDPRALLPLLLDGALTMVAVALGGGADSAVIYVTMVLPIAAAIVVGPGAIVIIGFAGIASYALAAGSGEHLVVFVVEGFWSCAVAVAVARQRNAFLQRLGRIDQMVAAVSAPGRRVRDGVGPELRETVAAPLGALRTRLARRGTRPIDDDELHRLAAGVAACGVRVRSVVSELHAASGRPSGVDGPLLDLALRRAPAARVEISVGVPTDPRFDALLVAIVRDALTVVATPEASSVAIAVTPTTHGAAVRVAADPPPRREPADAAERREVLALRVAAADALLETEDPGAGVVGVRVRNLRATADHDPRMPLSGLVGVRKVVVFCRVLGAVAASAAGLVIGGNDPLWPLAALATTMVTLPMARLLLSRRVAVRTLVACIAIDTVPILTMWALSGPETQRALIPIVALLPVVWAFVSGPGVILLISTTIIGGGWAFSELGEAGPATLLTGVWATAIGLLVSRVGMVLGAQLQKAAQDRGRKLQLLMEGEENERRRLAADLHDDALQLLLSARQDLLEAAEGDPDGTAYALRALDDADAALRYVLSDLDLDDGAARLDGGLLAALTEVAEDVQRRRRGPTVVLDVDPRAEGRRDGLLVRLSRELLSNVVRHATATTVRVTIAADPGGIRLEIADDGVGFDRDRVRNATGRGHVGLATLEERVRDAGGSTELLDGDGGGALVRIELPGDGSPVVLRPRGRAAGAAGRSTPAPGPS